MIQTHTSLKYLILIEADDFIQGIDPWHVEIRDQFHRHLINIEKEDCYRDNLGHFYFNLNDVPTGKYEAKTTAQVPDDDFRDGYMTIIDRQDLVSVGLHDCPCHHKETCPCHETEGIKVTFERVYTKHIDGGDYLCDKFGNYILTSDGKRISFTTNNIISEDMAKVTLNMSGEEFLQLIQGRDKEGKVESLVEVVDVMQGMSDEEEMQVTTNEDINSMMDRILNN